MIRKGKKNCEQGGVPEMVRCLLQRNAWLENSGKYLEDESVHETHLVAENDQ